MSAPDFVVVGHVVEDLTPQGSRLGGTATFAAIQALRLGLSAGIVTRATTDTLSNSDLNGIALAGRDSDTTTVFQNTYSLSGRNQRILSRADAITGDDVPPAWRSTPIMLLGPVCGEDQLEYEDFSSDALVGIGAQGWLRELDGEGHVRPRPWTGESFWRGCTVLFVSEEDLGDDESQLARWVKDVAEVVVTHDRHGANIHDEGRWREIEAFPADDVDPTGAGDVFSAAYLVRYYETEDVAEAARFATAAAACSIEAEGVAGIADRQRIEERLNTHPEIVLA